MIGWMLRAMIVAAALALAAELAERALVALHRPRRWVWVAALLTGAMLPVVLRLLPATPSTRVPVEALSGLLAASAASARVLPHTDEVWTRGVEWAWALGSTLLLAVLGYTLLRLRAARRGWVATEVGGEPVLLSDRVGPAVVGLLRPIAVVPAWVAAAPVPERALVLAHERAHIRAGDPWLLAGAAVVTALVPWNPALWWAGRRLRAAVEADCDARVLAAGADRVDYASLLVSTAARSIGAPRLQAALVESRSLVERRVRAMLRSVPRRPVRALGLFACAGVVAAIACDLGSSEVSPRAASAGAETRAATAPPKGDSIFGFRVPAPSGAVLPETVMYVRTDSNALERVRTDRLPYKIRSREHETGASEMTSDPPVTVGTGTARRLPDGSTTGMVMTAKADWPPPIWVVNGRRVTAAEGNPLKNLSPDRIASVSVWKGPQAVGRYGAAPGQAVIEITTK